MCSKLFHLANLYDLYYVTDGCKKDSSDNQPDFTPGYFAIDEMTAHIRCCSTDSFSNTTCITTRECGETELTYTEAAAYCANEGRRICTKSEIEAKTCCGTGGTCDNYKVWTSTTGTSISKYESGST